jgi:hypothetical protein
MTEKLNHEDAKCTKREKKIFSAEIAEDAEDSESEIQIILSVLSVSSALYQSFFVPSWLAIPRRLGDE